MAAVASVTVKAQDFTICKIDYGIFKDTFGRCYRAHIQHCKDMYRLNSFESDIRPAYPYATIFQQHGFRYKDVQRPL